MTISNSVRLAVFVLLLAPAFLDAGGKANLSVSWALSNGAEFFNEVVSHKGAPQRFFVLDIEKAREERIGRCEQEVHDRKPQSDFCRGLAARLAPAFDFAFTSDSPHQLVLDRIEVNCREVTRHRGRGFSRDLAFYSLLLPAKTGITSFTPPNRLTFTGTGTLTLRLWPDFNSVDADTVSLTLTFHFVSGEQVSSGPFTLRL